MYIIENQLFEVKVGKYGAELCSFFNKKEEIEYIWQANPDQWSSHAPIMFPIVGALKGGKFIWQDKPYSLKDYGFACDMEFELLEQTDDSLVLKLNDTLETKESYPFSFELIVKYTLTTNALQIEYEVKNMDTEDMLFSIGGRPGFNCPIYPGEKYQDYFIEFETDENVHRWFTENQLLSYRQTLMLDHQKIIPLNKRKFEEGAIIFKNLKSTEISLKSNRLKKGIKLKFEDFPYFGIWAKPGSDFICLEPCCGIMDNHNTNRQFSEKEGIIKLESQKVFKRNYSIIPIF